MLSTHRPATATTKGTPGAETAAAAVSPPNPGPARTPSRVGPGASPSDPRDQTIARVTHVAIRMHEYYVACRHWQVAPVGFSQAQIDQDGALYEEIRALQMTEQDILAEAAATNEPLKPYHKEAILRAIGQRRGTASANKEVAAP